MWTQNGLKDAISLHNLVQPQHNKIGLAQTTFSLFREIAGGFKELHRDELFARTAAARRNYTVLNIAEGLGIVVRAQGANKKTLRMWDRVAWMDNATCIQPQPLCMDIPKLTIQGTLEGFLKFPEF